MVILTGHGLTCLYKYESHCPGILVYIVLQLTFRVHWRVPQIRFQSQPLKLADVVPRSLEDSPLQGVISHEVRLSEEVGIRVLALSRRRRNVEWVHRRNQFTDVLTFCVQLN